MKLSVVTINYNNADGLKKTMDSVIAQSWKDFEYLVIDGGSSDSSVAIIEAHKSHITYWVSENDGGVYNAMNKGIARASGEYILFLNSGDYLADKHVLQTCFKNAFLNADLVYGDLWIEQSGKLLHKKNYPGELSFDYFLKDGNLPHPATFIRRNLFDSVGYYNESLRIVSDWEFWLKSIFLYNATYKRIDLPISVFNLEGISSKAENQLMVLAEKEGVYSVYFPNRKEDYLKFKKGELRNKRLKSFFKGTGLRRLFKKLASGKV